MFIHTRVSHRDSDGLESIIACDGVRHYEVFLPEYGFRGEKPFVNRDDACDGSCRDRDVCDEIIAKLMKLSDETFNTGEEVLKTRLVIPAEVFTLLESGQLMGREVRSWYVKRNSEGTVYRLACGKSLKIATRYDELACLETGYYHTVEVTLESCGPGSADRAMIENASNAAGVDRAIFAHKAEVPSRSFVFGC